jgi:hypothetical protein
MRPFRTICNGHWGLNSYRAHGTGGVVDHNLVFGNKEGDCNFTAGASDYAYTQGKTLAADPCFLHPASTEFDAHLARQSPAIGAGVNPHEVFATSLDGVARPTTGPWDLGPYVCTEPKPMQAGP